MKKILLLGGYGFIGTNMLDYIDRCCGDQYRVVVFDKLPVHPLGLRFQCVEASFSGDFSDKEVLRSIFENHSFDMVVHSLSSTVPSTSKDIRFDIESNLIATIELLNLMTAYKNYNIIYLSSGGAIYGDSNAHKLHRESDKAMPLSSYGVVKLAIEKYLYQFHRNEGLKPTILRLSNPYGPFHYSNKQGVINIALRSALNGSRFSVWGDGQARKDYIYIEDCVRAILYFTENQPINSTINIGSGETFTIMQIIERIQQLIPTFGFSREAQKAFDVTHFELDVTELHRLIPDFRHTSMDQGLSLTFNWQKGQLT